MNTKLPWKQNTDTESKPAWKRNTDTESKLTWKQKTENDLGHSYFNCTCTRRVSISNNIYEIFFFFFYILLMSEGCSS